MQPSSAGVQALSGFAIALATAVVILAVSILPFLTPAWVGFEQARSGTPALTGFSDAEMHAVTNSILADLVLGGGDFLVTRDGSDAKAAAPGGTPVLTEAERSHMRDVRGVFSGFAAIAMVSALWLLLTRRRARAGAWRPAWWRAVRRGARGLAVAVVVLGAIALVAFDAAFEVFHRLFFAPGTFDFDPRTSHLVQLFPDQFWSETTIVLAVAIFAVALALTWFAGRQIAPRPAPRLGSSIAVGEASR